MTDTVTAPVNPDTITLTSSSRPTLSVYDGQTRLGHLVRRGGGFEAIDIDGTSYGIFPDMKAAAFALPVQQS